MQNLIINSVIHKVSDSGQANIDACPICNVKKIGITFRKRINDWGACSCNNCQELFIIEGLRHSELLPGSTIPVNTIPKATSQYLQKKNILPQEIQNTFEQAVKCYEIGCFDASITMSRRVIQEVARSIIKEKGIIIKNSNGKFTSLEQELKSLVDNKVIFQKTYEMYTNVKDIANFGAHPDEIDSTDTVTEEESELALMIIELLIKEIYENDELYKRIENNQKVIKTKITKSKRSEKNS